MATLFTVNGVTVSLCLDTVERNEDGSGYTNGIVTAPAGATCKTISVGGGWVLSAEAAMADNHSRGLQPDTHPDIYWPGAKEAGDFDAYDGFDNGDLDGLAEAVGLDIDRDTEEGDDNWRMLIKAVQSASAKEWEAALNRA